MAIGGSFGNFKNLGCFLRGAAGQNARFQNARLARVGLFEFLERAIESENLLARILQLRQIVAEGNAFGRAAALFAMGRAGWRSSHWGPCCSARRRYRSCTSAVAWRV